MLNFEEFELCPKKVFFRLSSRTFSLSRTETILFGARGVPAPSSGDWTRDATSKPLLGAMPLTNWMLCFQKRDEKVAKEFFGMLREVGKVLGINVADPHTTVMTVDTNIAYVNAVSEAVVTNKVNAGPASPILGHFLKKECHVIISDKIDLFVPG